MKLQEKYDNLIGNSLLLTTVVCILVTGIAQATIVFIAEELKNLTRRN